MHDLLRRRQRDGTPHRIFAALQAVSPVPDRAPAPFPSLPIT